MYKANHITMLIMSGLFTLVLLAGCSSKKKSEEDMGSGQENMAKTETFTANLSGSDEVPSVTSDGTGMVTVSLKGDSIMVKGTFSGLSSKYVASHIHKAVKGENGGVIQPLSPAINADSTSGSFEGSYMLDSSQIAALKADSLYINVHSADHPGGELRGQLTASGSGM